MEENEQPGQFVVDQPWTQSDTIQLQRLNQDLGSLDSQVNEGVLYPQEAEPEKQAIMQERQQLLARQQKAQLAQKGQARMQMQDEAANAHAMQWQNTENAAQNFTKSMPLYIDPDTGEKTMFYPTGDGKFAPIPKSDTSATTDEEPLQAALPDDGEEDGSTAAIPIDPPSTAPMPPQPGEHVMTIRNGQWEERAVFNAQGQQIRTEYPRDANGMEVKPPWVVAQQQEEAAVGKEATTLGLSARDQKAVMAQAKLLTPPPQLTGNRNHDAVAMRKYQEDLGKTARLLTVDAFKQRAATLAAKRKQELEDKKLTPVQKSARNAGFTPHDVFKMLGEMEKEVSEDNTRVDGWKSSDGSEYGGGAWKEMPKKVQQEEAERRLKTRLDRMGGQSEPQKPETTAKAAESGAGASAAPKPAETPPVPETLNKVPPSVIEAELQRRASKKAGPGFFERLVTPGRQGAGGVK